MSGDYGVSIWGKFSRYGRFGSGGIAPLSQVFSVGLTSLMVSSAGLILWVWVKSIMGGGISLSSVLTYFHSFSSSQVFSASSVWLSNLAGKFSLNLE